MSILSYPFKGLVVRGVEVSGVAEITYNKHGEWHASSVSFADSGPTTRLTRRRLTDDSVLTALRADHRAEMSLAVRSAREDDDVLADL